MKSEAYVINKISESYVINKISLYKRKIYFDIFVNGFFNEQEET